MRKATSLFLSAIMAVSSVAMFASTSADAQPRHSRYERERYVQNYCRRNPRDRDCRIDRSRWDDRRYQRWYRDRHRGNAAEAAAAGIFGFAAGAIAGAAAGAADGTRRARCEARYRSYDWRSNTFIGSDGRRYQCRL